jgi:putative peptidoglycan lipid II flippase
MINQIFNSRTKTVTFAAILLAISALISGILSLIGDGLLAGKFGVWGETNIYFTAFKIPDLVYNLLIVGGLGISFLPIFSEYYQKDEKKAWEMTNHILNVFLFFLILISLILFIFTPQLIHFIAPGFSSEAKEETVLLTRLMFLSPIFFGLSSIFSSILQYFDRFLIYSLCPILYNLGIIFGILFLAPKFGILGVGMGVILGAFFHWIIQIPSAINCGFRYKFLFNFKYPAIKKIFSLMFPRIFAVAAQQINLIIINAIASTILGAISIFNFANNLQNFPVTIIGVSFAIASFPILSKNWANGQKKEFLENFSLTFRQILYLIIPISLLLFILRAQIVRLVLGSLGKEFDWVATRLTAASLGIFSISILASALIPLLYRAFFSLQDTKTPTSIAILSIILNIILTFSFTHLLNSQNLLSLFFIKLLKLKGIEKISAIGLPLAFSFSSIFQFLFLFLFFQKRIGDFEKKEILISFKKIIFASIFLIFLTYFSLYFWAQFLNTHTIFGLFFQTILAGLAGFLSYFLITLYLKSPEIKTIKSSISKQFQKY